MSPELVRAPNFFKFLLLLSILVQRCSKYTHRFQNFREMNRVFGMWAILSDRRNMFTSLPLIAF